MEIPHFFYIAQCGGLRILRSIDEYYLHAIVQVFNKLNHNESEFKKHAFFTLRNTVKKNFNKKLNYFDLGNFLNDYNCTTYNALVRKSGKYANIFTKF